mgnify:CR=1 FL=1
MSIVKAIKTARRIKRFERRHNANVHQLLNNLTDPTLLDRMAREEEKEYILTPKGKAEARKLAYSKKRELVQ